MRRRRFAGLLASALLPPAARATTAPDSTAATATPLPPDTIARLLAGLEPMSGHPAVDRIVAGADWRAHRDWVRSRWADVRPRLDAMRRWRETELRMPDASRRTLLYPFSGPDFLNADAIFPTHGRMLCFGLERPGRLPEIERLDGASVAKLLADVRSALADLFERNYFITDSMTKQLTSPHLKGTLPVFAATMALAGHRIVSVGPLDPFPQLTADYAAPDLKPGVGRPRIPLRGVRIVFDRPGGAERTLDYYSLDATDRELRWYPQFVELLAATRPATVFLKSASYLLHDGQFAGTRDALMATADVVVQDDTGIPFRRLQEAGWSVRLYGVYSPPLKSMRYAAQPDLEAAYRSAGAVPALDFPFGYKGRDGRSTMLVARRER